MALTTYDPAFTAQAESVEDYINPIDDLVTPFYSSLSKVSAGNGDGAKKEEWQERAYRAAADNAQLEAGAAPTATNILPSRLANYMQIFSNTASVSRSSRTVKSYGMADTLTDQIQEHMSGQQIDIEHSMVGLYTDIASDENAVNPTDATAFKDATREAGYENGSNAGRQASIHGLIDSSLQYENGGTGRDFSEQLVINALTGIYNATKRRTQRVCLVKASDMFVTAEFASTAGETSRIRDSADRTVLVNYVETYVTPFGNVTFVPDTYIADESAIIYDPSMTDCIELSAMEFGEIDSGTIKVTTAEISTELTLALRNRYSAAYIGDLN